MTWQTPKTDWLSTDGFTNTDANRIEGNIAHIGDNTILPLQAMAGTSLIFDGTHTSYPLAGGTELDDVAPIMYLPVAPGYKVVFKQLSNYSTSDLILPRLYVGVSLKYTGASGRHNMNAETTLVENFSGITLYYTIIAKLYNPESGSVLVHRTDGFSCRIEVKEI